MTQSDREPVFVRRGRWVYDSRWVYNTRGPVARVLMFATAVGLVGPYLYVSDNGQWSESGLRDAVHEAARELEAPPRKVYFGYESLIRDALTTTDEGPGADLVIKPADEGTPDSFGIGATFMFETYCMRLSTPRAAARRGQDRNRLSGRAGHAGPLLRPPRGQEAQDARQGGRLPRAPTPCCRRTASA